MPLLTVEKMCRVLETAELVDPMHTLAHEAGDMLAVVQRYINGQSDTGGQLITRDVDKASLINRLTKVEGAVSVLNALLSAFPPSP